MNHLDIVKYLIEKGADIHPKTHQGLTPLLFVAKVPYNLKTLHSFFFKKKPFFCKYNYRKVI